MSYLLSLLTHTHIHRERERERERDRHYILKTLFIGIKIIFLLKHFKNIIYIDIQITFSINHFFFKLYKCCDYGNFQTTNTKQF